MIGQILLFSVVLGAVLASRSSNQYIDNVIQTSLPREIRSLGLDPAPLSNFRVNLGLNAYADFTFGNASGLNRIRRKSDCPGPKMAQGKLTINCTFSLNSITTSYKVVVKNGSNIYNLGAKGKVSETVISTGIYGNPPNYIGSVANYHVDRLGQITPSFARVPSNLQKYTRVLNDYYKTEVLSQLHKILQQKYVYAIGRAVAYTPMPRQ